MSSFPGAAAAQHTAHGHPPLGVSGGMHGTHEMGMHAMGMHGEGPMSEMGEMAAMDGGGSHLMFTYRFMRMSMEGTRDGTESVSDAAVVDANGPYGYMVTPTAMPMDMHMLGVMWAPRDWLSLFGMGSYNTRSMDHLTRSGGSFTTESSGIGDTRVGVLLGLRNEGVKVHFNAGVSLPTGSIDERDATPVSAPNEVRLPYPMQIGSGTVDLEPGLTVHDVGETLAWGAQIRGVIRTGENENGYTLGDRVLGTAWGQYSVSDQLSASVRIEAQRWAAIDGADPLLNPAMVYTADPSLQAGTRVDLPLGLNWYFASGALTGHRLAVELSLPIYQDLDGPQMEAAWALSLGWQKSLDLF